MYLTGLTHRDQLFDVASRWIAARIRPDDGRVVTEIFAFERLITAPTVRVLVADLCAALGRHDLRLERVLTKDAVRQAIVRAAVDPTPRVQELLGRYQSLPDEFFPGTPVIMSLITSNNGRLAAMVRRKRLRRIADKASRRVSEHLAQEIRAAARSLAQERAHRVGVSLEQLVSSSEEMAEEFATAERIVAERLRRMETTLDPGRLSVDDVIGVKILGTTAELERLEAALDARPGTKIVERQVREGSYCGTHYLVDLELPSPSAIANRMRGSDWLFAGGRGLPASTLETGFFEYLERGSRWFRIELILTTFEDLVESEFGRCIHEVRVLDQRDFTTYSGRIAQNASYIIEYLLRLAISPTITVPELPIKIWGRYLRDTVALALAQLSGNEPLEWLVEKNETTCQALEG